MGTATALGRTIGMGAEGAVGVTVGIRRGAAAVSRVKSAMFSTLPAVSGVR